MAPRSLILAPVPRNSCDRIGASVRADRGVFTLGDGVHDTLNVLLAVLFCMHCYWHVRTKINWEKEKDVIFFSCPSGMRAAPCVRVPSTEGQATTYGNSYSLFLVFLFFVSQVLPVRAHPVQARDRKIEPRGGPGLRRRLRVGGRGRRRRRRQAHKEPLERAGRAGGIAGSDGITKILVFDALLTYPNRTCTTRTRVVLYFIITFSTIYLYISTRHVK